MDGTLQAQPPAGVPEGLPFWLLWFLLCVILLLVAFIFLRDKDLRRRISAFLSGARRHMIRLRLQVKLKKEREKKAALWRELGKLAWNEDVRASCIDEECAKLSGLDEEIGRHQKTWHDVYSRIEVLGREHDAALTRFRALVAEQEEGRRPHQEEMLALANRKKELLEALEASLREAEAAEAQLKAVEKEVRQAEENPKIERGRPDGPIGQGPGEGRVPGRPRPRAPGEDRPFSRRSATGWTAGSRRSRAGSASSTPPSAGSKRSTASASRPGKRRSGSGRRRRSAPRTRSSTSSGSWSPCSRTSAASSTRPGSARGPGRPLLPDRRREQDDRRPRDPPRAPEIACRSPASSSTSAAPPTPSTSSASSRRTYDVAGFFSNSNIQPREEYDLRLEEARKVARTAGVPLLEDDYDPDGWSRLTRKFKDEPEKGRRCDVCYAARLRRTAETGGPGRASTPSPRS